MLSREHGPRFFIFYLALLQAQWSLGWVHCFLKAICYESRFQEVCSRYVIKKEERKEEEEEEGEKEEEEETKEEEERDEEEKDGQGKSLNHPGPIFIRMALRCQSRHSLTIQEEGVPLPHSLLFLCSMKESHFARSLWLPGARHHHVNLLAREKSHFLARQGGALGKCGLRNETGPFSFFTPSEPKGPAWLGV